MAVDIKKVWGGVFRDWGGSGWRNVMHPDADVKMDGTTDDHDAWDGLEAPKGYEVPAGTSIIGSDVTISAPLKFSPGAMLKPGSGVTVTLKGKLEAPLTKIFDLSAGGVVAIARTARHDVHPEWWGALGNADAVYPDVPADDSTPLTQAFATGRAVRGGPDALYRCESSVVTPVGDLEIFNLRLRPIATLTGTTCISNNVAIKKSTTLTTSVLRAGSRVIDVADTTGMASGDILRIGSDEAWPYSNQGIIFKGETTRIETVDSGTQLTLKLPLFCSYDTGAEAVDVVAYGGFRLRVAGLEVEYPTQVDKAGIGFAYFADVNVRDLRAKNCQQVGASMGGLVNGTITGGSLEDNFVTGYGYGMQLVECTQIVVSNMAGSKNRHAIDVSGAVPSHGCRINSCTIVGHPDEGSCLSTHGSANGTAFVGNTLIGGIIGIAGSGPNDHIHGNTFIGCLYPIIVGAPGFTVTHNINAHQPKPAAGGANPNAIDNNFVTIQLGDGTVTEADFWFSGAVNTIAGNSGVITGAAIYIDAAISILKYTKIADNHFAFVNGGGNVALIESGHAGTPLTIDGSCRIENNTPRNVNGAYRQFRNIEWANPGIGTTTANAAGTAEVGHIGQPAQTSMTNGQAFTFTMEPLGAVMFSIADGSSAKGGLFFADYAAATITILSDPSSYFENSASPTSGKVGVYKSAGSGVISVKNNVGSTRSLGICVVGASVSAVTAPA